MLPFGDVILGEWNKNAVSNAVYHHGTFSDVPKYVPKQR